MIDLSCGVGNSIPLVSEFERSDGSRGALVDAFRVFVEDTSSRNPKRFLRRRTLPTPKLVLQISDCMNEINLEFDVSSADYRDNSLYKIDTLLAALQRFRDGLAAEAELYEQRELELRAR